MNPGFYLKCGMHWTSITLGIGGILLHCGSADANRATCFDTREHAEAMAAKCSKRQWGVAYDVVEVKA
jgi:hypothetical protein